MPTNDITTLLADHRAIWAKLTTLRAREMTPALQAEIDTAIAKHRAIWLAIDSRIGQAA